MKRPNYLALFAIVATVSLFLSSCNKDTPPTEMISFDSEEIMDNVPDGLLNSTDSYAEQCVSGIETALDMSSFMSDMEPPDDAIRTLKGGSTWQWTVTNFMYTITFYWTYEEDSEKRYWTMEIKFGDGESYPYITAWETKDGSEGEIQYNFGWTAAYQSVEDYEDLYWKYHWNKDASGNYTFTWNYESSDDTYQYYLSYEVVVNADGSGSINYYSMDVLFYHMEWDSLGNGSYTYYYSGTQEISGSWTV